MSIESIRGANEDRMKRFTKVAFTDMTLLVGPEMAVEKVLEQLQEGVRTECSISAELWRARSLEDSDDMPVLCRSCCCRHVYREAP